MTYLVFEEPEAMRKNAITETARIKRDIQKGKKYQWSSVIIDYLGNECCYCKGGENLDIHHIVPLGRGGSHTLGNLELVCAGCHLGLHKMWEVVYPKKKALLFKCEVCDRVSDSNHPNRRFCHICRALRSLKSARAYNGRKKEHA